MRTICDVCESAPAILFCAADEAALCQACDDKVHMCNKLACRHVRVGLTKPVDVPRCDICETAPAFFYCEVDGSSLCLQCDMIVHVGGKRTHGRYLQLRQRVEFPGDKSERAENTATQTLDMAENKRQHSQSPKTVVGDNQQNHNSTPPTNSDAIAERYAKQGTQMIDLNMQPHRAYGQSSNNQEL